MPIRVLHASPSYAPAYRLGGPIRSVEGLVAHLCGAGVAVRVLTTNSDGYDRLATPTGWTMRGEIPIRYVRRWVAPSGTPTYLAYAFAEARRAHVVHVAGVFSACSIQALVAAHLARRPVILSPHGAMQPRALQFGSKVKKRLWLAGFGQLFRSVTMYHATSDEERDAIRALMGSNTPVTVVPNGTEVPTEPLTYAPAGAGRTPIIGFVGRIHPVKALPNLLAAAGVLQTRGLDFELEIAGPMHEAGYREELERIAVSVGVSRRVHFLGELDGQLKTDFYYRGRVFVLPSHTENFGNVVIEALAHGAPVVASRGTPWAELDTWGCGRWVENTPQSLADAIEPYLRDEQFARASGQLGRAVVAQRYSWHSVAQQMASLYRAAMKS